MGFWDTDFIQRKDGFMSQKRKRQDGFMSQKIATLNVIEMVQDNPPTIINHLSFMDNEEGYKEAINIFTRIIVENGCLEEDVKAAIVDGYTKNNYCVMLIHST